MTNTQSNSAEPALRHLAHSTTDIAEELRHRYPQDDSLGLSSHLVRAIIKGAKPWIFSAHRPDRELLRALGAIEHGRIRRTLLLTVPAESPPEDSFWNALESVLSCQGITDIRVSVISRAELKTEIPKLGKEIIRYSDVKLYIANLAKPEIEWKFSTNHKRNIAKAKKAGILFSLNNSPAALDTHFNLTESSVNRRQLRGESIALRSTRENVKAIFESPYSRLYQASANEVVLSSKLVFTIGQYAFYFDGGTSPQGMKSGASHFLMSQIMSTLKHEGFLALNLGVAADENGELWRYKVGYGPDTYLVQHAVYERASFFLLMKNFIRHAFSFRKP